MRSKAPKGLNNISKQHFIINQVIEDGEGTQHEMKIGDLTTGDVGLMSGETLYGKFIIRPL